MTEKLELLAPAGTLQTLKAVIHAGADAVYFGGSRFGARAYAGNLNQEEVLEAIDFAHIHNRKTMLAVNTLLKEKELEKELYEYLLPYYERGLDAVIVQDFGVMRFIRRNFKGLPVHASTQMTVTGAAGAEFLAQAGAERIVLARELSLSEIRDIHRKVPVELESFVHGALCYCYSGQCLLSSMLGGRSGNRGRCAQPCRLPYTVLEQGGKQNGKGHTYPLSPKDLCAIDLLPELAESGIVSFKIEGRMKQTEYAQGVVSIYRTYLDRYQNYGKEGYAVSDEDRKMLLHFGNRSGFTTGYYKQQNGPDMITFGKSNHKKEQDSAETVQAERRQMIRGRLCVRRDMPMDLTVKFRDVKLTVTGEMAEAAQNHPVTEEVLRQKLMKTKNTPFEFEHLSIVLDEGLFVPVKSVNELRRKALDRLEELYLRRYERTASECQYLKQEADMCIRGAEYARTPVTDGRKGEECRYQAQTAGVDNKNAESRLLFTASVEQEEQISPVLSDPFISVIYIDSTMFTRDDTPAKLEALIKEAKQVRKQVFYILPAVFRNDTAEWYASVLQNLRPDGFLVNNYDALGFLLKQGIAPERIRIDYNLYTWSTESRRAFLELGIAGDTIPLELNRAEIRRRENQGSEMMIYGYLPLMTSAQCIKKNRSHCDKTPCTCFLQDRYNICFPVKNNCNECYNVIYNSRPLSLLSLTKELESSGIRRVRLSFTIESKTQTEEILHAARTGGLDKTALEYTYGHYKRGAE